ncbi:MAG: MarR family transcriptional regulator [Blautia sp.]|jgi:DNA-binding MarR family transcriptional regulator
MLVEFRNNISLLKRLYDQLMEPVCQDYAITRMELDILLFLANNPKYDTAADIIRRRCLTKSHVSTSVKKLEDNGYLERKFHPGNRKSVHLSLKEPAGPIVKAGQAAQKSFFAVVFQGFSQEEINVVCENSVRIGKNILGALEEERTNAL